MIARFTVLGEPQGKGRPRFTGRGRAYTPAKTAAYERQIRRAYQAQSGQVFPDEAPLAVRIIAYYRVPASDSKRKRLDKLQHRIRPVKRPDVDNVCKAVFDALNGIAYKDDAQIVTAVVYKFYGDQPRVEVEIKTDDRTA